MINQWFELKQKALNLRKKGLSIGQIGSQLNIAKSTLSGWLKEVPLTLKQKQVLFRKWQAGLVKARAKAVIWHNGEKAKRLAIAEQEAELTLNGIDIRDKNILDLALAMLYLGEGSKITEETSMGNSDPMILKTFIYILKKNYNINPKKIRCELYLRADQSPGKMKKFWARELKLSEDNFKYFHLDQRTRGSKTFPSYKGVCMVRYGSVAIKRKLLNISRGFCESII